MFHVFYLFFIVGYISALFHGNLYNNFFVDFDLLEVGTTMRHHIYIFYLCLGQAVLFFNLSESNLDWWGQVEQCLIQSPVQRCTGLLWQALHFSSGSLVVVVVIIQQLDLQLPIQSVPITTVDVSLNPTQARCTLYNII